jgi:uncharacterized protein (DUF302 family)
VDPDSKGAVEPTPDGTLVIPTPLPFDDLLARLERSILASGLLLIAKPSASHNAAARGIHIPGNAVLLAFNNDLALRLLKLSVPAGFEAPMRLYVTENPDHTASVTYRIPSALIAPYAEQNAEITHLAQDLDNLFAKIVADALAG